MKMYIAGWCGWIRTLYLHSPSPPPYGSLPNVVFVVGTIEDCIRGVQNEFLGGWGGGYKCQLSVNSIQTLQNVASVLKKRGRLLCMGGRGSGKGGRKKEFPILFSAPHFLFHSASTAVSLNLQLDYDISSQTRALSEPIHLWKS